MNFLTELKEGLSISWGAIRANKMRSILTTLGIVIGILTVTLMGTAIEGLNRSFLKSISFIGADVLYVQRFNWFNESYEDWMKMRKRREITASQVQAIQRQLGQAQAIAPFVQSGAKVSYEKRHSDNVVIIGTTEGFQFTSGFTVAQGRFLSVMEVDGGRPVCVVGAEVAKNLFQQQSPLGARINIGQQTFEVVGVLEKQGSFMEGPSLDNQAIIPLKQYITHFESHPDFQIQVKTGDVHRLEEVKGEVRALMRRVRRLSPADPDDFAINQQDQVIELFHKVAGTIAGIGLFITGLSLFVGGIGIMNIMFVSVAERTREIGIRKALGAKRRTILLQFLMEAACICVIGGAIGLGLAWPLTLAMQKFMPAAMSPLVVGLAFLVSLATGVLSGFFPAWRAARMNPVDALRNET
jgi:putative ABC transport system permease protein